MSDSPDVTPDTDYGVRRRLPKLLCVIGLGGIAVGAVLFSGLAPVMVAGATAIIWWRASTPVAIAALTLGLAGSVSPLTAPVQFGTSVGVLTTVGVPIIVLAVGMSLLMVGSWLASGTEPLLAGGWTLLPLAVGWLCLGVSVVLDTALWLVLAACGTLTLIGANAISQITAYRLTTEMQGQYE